jgi:hypothetical protein
MLQLSTCARCGGHFVAHAHDHQHGYVCVLCRPPSRAGKTRAQKVGDEAVKAPRVVQSPAPSAHSALGAS